MCVLCSKSETPRGDEKGTCEITSTLNIFGAKKVNTQNTPQVCAVVSKGAGIK